MRRLISGTAILAIALMAACGEDKGGTTSLPAPTTAAVNPGPAPAPAPAAEPAEDQPKAAAPLVINWNPTRPDAVPYDAASPKNGTVKGKATFKGDTIPRRKKLDVSKDPQCGKAPLTEEEIVDKDTKGIQNVFVLVKAGHEGQKFTRPEKAVTLDQQGCMYVPRILGLMPGQKIEVINSDDTTHNVHGLPTKSKEFNFVQNKKGDRTETTIENEEYPVKIKCDIHPWMGAWAFVVPHTLFAVTAKDGTFTLPPLAPGEYTIVAWHEVYGSSEQKVSVKEGETKEIEFIFEKK